MKTCEWNEAWIGKCKNEVTDSDYCDEHNKKCSSCGNQATHSCDETGQFVCGAPLCNECEHTIAEDGTNGGIGFFRTSPLPEGFKSHCKKTDQIYLPWYSRERTELLIKE